MTATIDDVVWEAPGPGTWDLDSSHVGPAPGPIVRRLFASTMRPGSAAGMAEYGAPVDSLDIAWVHGKQYMRLVPLIGADRDDPRDPPDWVIRIVSRLHPTFRRRERRAAETFRTKRWRGDLDRWRTEWKPSLLTTNTAFAEVSVVELSDMDMARHLRDLDAHLVKALTLHQRLGPTMGAAFGVLMAHLEDWGLDPLEAFRVLDGASPATRAPVDWQRAIAEAVPDGMLAACRTLDDMRGTSPEAARLIEAYLREYGWRLTTGYDLEDRCLIELPDAVVTSIRSAARAPGAREPAQAGDAADALRSHIRLADQGIFDELVADAAESYGIRDENGPLTYEWPAGLLRRAVLECGSRLAGRGLLDRPAHVFELDVPEIVGLLTGEGGPGLDEIRARAEQRRRWAALDPPRRLGPDASDMSPTLLPPNLARLTRAITLILDNLESDPDHADLSGTGIGTEAATGRARVITDPAEALTSMEPGDIVIVQYTAPTYNAVLTMAGGLVTAEGGPMSHAGIIARELGLPAVIGVSGAMRLIADGATITVDPVAGQVFIRSP